MTDLTMPNVKDYLRAFGLWAEQAARDRGMKLTEVAEAANLSPARIRQIFDGKSRRKDRGPSRPEIETVLRMASILGKPQTEALLVAGYEPEDADKPDLQLARDLNRYLSDLPPQKQKEARQILLQTAKSLRSLCEPVQAA